MIVFQLNMLFYRKWTISQASFRFECYWILTNSTSIAISNSQTSWLLGRPGQEPPKGKSVSETIMDYSVSQLPPSDDFLYYDEVYPEA